MKQTIIKEVHFIAVLLSVFIDMKSRSGMAAILVLSLYRLWIASNLIRSFAIWGLQFEVNHVPSYQGLSSTDGNLLINHNLDGKRKGT
jgi:hypothetical protein